MLFGNEVEKQQQSRKRKHLHTKWAECYLKLENTSTIKLYQIKAYVNGIYIDIYIHIFIAHVYLMLTNRLYIVKAEEILLDRVYIKNKLNHAGSTWQELETDPALGMIALSKWK